METDPGQDLEYFMTEDHQRYDVLFRPVHFLIWPGMLLLVEKQIVSAAPLESLPSYTLSTCPVSVLAGSDPWGFLVKLVMHSILQKKGQLFSSLGVI